MADYIDRQAALDAFSLSEKTRKYGGDHSGYDTLLKYEIQNIIEDLPSADVRDNRVGEWIPHEDEDGEHYGDCCSICGAWYVMPHEKTKFCPNCGADMRGAE